MKLIKNTLIIIIVFVQFSKLILDIKEHLEEPILHKKYSMNRVVLLFKKIPESLIYSELTAGEYRFLSEKTSISVWHKTLYSVDM